MIEHFHPDDTLHHFKIVYNLLQKGGCYVFSTPHRFCGPSDISSYFCYEPEGFHLKEWTYSELIELMKKIGFKKIKTYVFRKKTLVRLPNIYFTLLENLFNCLPKKYRKLLSKFFINSITISATK